MTTSTFSTEFGQSGFADSTTVAAVGSASKHSARFGFDPEEYDRPPMTPRARLQLGALLIATAGFWLIVAWTVWSAW